MSESGNSRHLVDRDRNLLFGVLAVQMHKITPSQLVEHAAAWATDPSLSLAERLVQAGVLARPERDLIASFVDQAIETHGGDATATLNTISQEEEHARRSLNRTLSALGDPPPPNSSRAPTLLAEPLDPDAIPAVQESAGRYTQIGEFAQGGMGRILLVHDQFLGRQVAMKELLSGSGSSRIRPEDQAGATPSNAQLNRFLQEARITGQLEHPSIVPVYELGHRPDGTLYYTMKFLRGKTLAQVFQERATLEERSDLLNHFVDACQAIAYAHSRGVIHRDIKPSNILIGEFGETVLIDWGLAKAMGREDINACRLPRVEEPSHLTPQPEATDTVYGMAIGTPAYMPPEQALGQIERIDERSDIYSLGVVLYELLAGRVPFPEKDPGTVVRKVVADTPAPLLDVNPEVPPELAAICEHAMHKDPAQRYASAMELADEVTRFLSGGLVRAYQYGFGEHLRRFVLRYKGTLAVAGLLLAVLVGVGVFSYVRVLEEKGVAVSAQRLAEEAHQRAVSGRRLAEQQFYYASIGLADRAIVDYRFAQARAYLEACPHDLRDWEWGRLQYLCNLDLLSVQAHEGPGHTVAFSPDGTRFATGGADETVRLWDVADGRLSGVFEASAGNVRALAFSPDGRRIAVASDNGMAQVWDVAAARLELTLAGHSSPLTDVAFSPDGSVLATAAEDHTAALWDAATGRRAQVLEGHTEAVSCLAFSPDGTALATGSADNSVAVWHLDDGSLEAAFEGHVNDVLALAFSPDGRFIATGGRDASARVWERETQRLRASLQGHEREVTAVAFTPDGSGVFTAGLDRTARLWQLPESAAWAAAEDLPEDLRLLLAEEVARETQIYAGHAGGVTALAVHPDGWRFATIDTLGAAKLWHARTSVPRFLLRRFFDEMDYGASSPDGRFYATQGGSPRETLVWSTVEKRIAARIEGHADAVRAVAFSPDSRVLATAGADRTVRLWDAATGEAVATAVGHGAAVTSTTFSSDGRLLATGSEDRTIRVWAADSAEPLHTLDNPGGAVRTLAFAPSGDLLASGDDEHGVRLWQAGQGAAKGLLGAHAAPVTALAFDPESKRLATGGSDSRILIWDLDSRSDPLALLGHGGAVRTLSFTADGHRLASGADDNTARVWDAATGQELLNMDTHAGPVVYGRFWPEDHTLVTSSGRDIVSWPHLPVVRDPDLRGAELQRRMEALKREFWARVQESRPWEEEVEVRDTASPTQLHFSPPDLEELLEKVADLLRQGLARRDAAVAPAPALMGGRAERAILERMGLRRGDFVRAVNGRPIASPGQLLEALEAFVVSPGAVLRFEAARDQQLVLIELHADPDTP